MYMHNARFCHSTDTEKTKWSKLQRLVSCASMCLKMWSSKFVNFTAKASSHEQDLSCMQSINENVNLQWRHWLGRTWASPTLVWLHWWKLCVCLRPYTITFKWEYLNIPWRPGSFMHAICPAHCRVVSVASPFPSYCQSTASAWRKPEERRRLKLTHAWQLRTMTDKSRLLTDNTNHAQ